MKSKKFFKDLRGWFHYDENHPVKSAFKYTVTGLAAMLPFIAFNAVSGALE
jgi:hypothetical protein